MIRRVRVKVAAKVNLSLNITGRANGYHLLDSVFASVALYDTVTVAERLDGKIRAVFSNSRIDPANNRAVAAAEALRHKFGGFGADIIVENRIPSGGGLGGSSADAAGVLRALDALYDFTARGAQLDEIAAGVGSDVPFMIRGGMARVGGRGERVDFFSGRTDRKIVLITPPSPVSTPQCFRRFDERGDEGTVADMDALTAALRSGADCTPYIGNALYPAACELNPQVAETALLLERAGGRAVMTGSGSSCVGFFDSLPDELADKEIALTDEGIVFV